MPEQQYSRWRSLANPISHLDPIQPDSPLSRLEEGKLPHGLVLLIDYIVHANGKEVITAPIRFESNEHAERYLSEADGITIRGYFLIPNFDAL